MKPTNYKIFYIPAFILVATGLLIAILSPLEHYVYALIAIFLGFLIFSIGSVANYRPKQ